MKLNKKEQILQGLDDNGLIATEIIQTRQGIKVSFVKGNKKGKFEYTLIGDVVGIDESEYDEEDNEDIYADIHEWVEKNITHKLKIYYNKRDISDSKKW